MTFKVDPAAFWQENRQCSHRYTAEKPRLALSLSIGEDVIKSIVGVTEHPRFYNDFEFQQETRAKASVILEREIGLTAGPAINAGSVIYASLFGGEVIYPDNAPPWIRPVIYSKDDIAAVIQRVQDADLLELGIMPRWLAWRCRIQEEYGVNLGMGTGFHGPATIAAMLCGTTTFLLFLYDYPDLMHELYRTIEKVGIRFMREMRVLTGLPMQGMAVYDDDSALLSPTLFAEFEYPVLDRWYSEFCPNPEDRRYVHSDGNMSHLLDMLCQLGIRHVNLGPQVDLVALREAMPETVIHGHVPPFLVRNGTPEQIVASVAADFQRVGHDGGMVIATAGSLNEGTLMENIRALMCAVAEYCCFDRPSPRADDGDKPLGPKAA